MRTPVVLVVDDEELLRMLATDMFADAGFEVLEARNGHQAVALLSARPDIRAVVTDVQMPGEPDGFALSHLVRERNPDCAIVVVSGRAAPQEGDMAVDARFVAKPYQGEDIVSLVRDMIDRTETSTKVG